LETIKLHIDGKEITAEKGQTVLNASLAGGVYIPHICHHPDLRPVGTCGLCVVEIEGTNEPLPACTTPADDSMVVRTKTDRISRMRRKALETLLAGHPPECVECPKYLNCELQSIKQFMGLGEDHSRAGQFKPLPVDAQNPLFLHDFVRCIKCGRCVRACNELRGVGVLQFIEEADQTRVGIPREGSLAEAGCRFCGACVEVCPTGALRDKPELMEGKKRRQALIPCRYACPAQIDVPRYVRLVNEGRYAEATAVIREKVPFPMVLGHVCNHLCENVCRRGQVNEPIAIRDLKRFAAEHDQDHLWEKNARREPATDKRVAVVGGGPAGLTAAFYLAKLGHAVTVFEALPSAGGMMRYGIPEYRLPRDVLDREIKQIEHFGVTIKTGARIESLDSLRLDEDFDAVLVTVGTHAGQKLPIPGADLGGVLIGLEFLRNVNLGNPVEVGSKVVVMGGGNVAFDCARLARRLGVREVVIACLENKSTMPAACDEIEEGEEEGIAVLPMLTFTRIIGDNGRVAGVECLKVSVFEFDEEGGVTIETIEGSERTLAADTVIFAIGQRPQIPDQFEMDLDERGRIEIDPFSLETSVEGVFAAGDAVMGTTSVIQAVAAGRDAAVAVDKYLEGGGNIDETLVPLEAAEPCLGPGEGFATMTRCQKSCIGAEERVASFCSIVQTLDAEAAIAEASRCLRCDLRLKITPVRFWGDY
jgi:NADPH-dependent glutamate synthase beta subunit-like oxidoreductase/ferredoxin/Pyruvate/2-oxoacid:ferredoxin oxidoreductase delta subunit